MSIDKTFTPRSLNASEYVRELFGPADNVAILVRNRSTGHTVQTIAKAEAIAGPGFQSWLANRSAAGSDIYVGMNPIKDGAYSRTKENIATSISTSTEMAMRLSTQYGIRPKSQRRTLS